MTETEKDTRSLDEKLDEILARLDPMLDPRVTLICPLCGASVEHTHSVELIQGSTLVGCPMCIEYFEVEVRPQSKEPAAT